MIRPFLNLVILSVLGAATLVAALLFIASGLPRFQDVKSRFKSSDQTILDRNGHVLDEIRVEKKYRRLEWVSIDEVSPVFVDVLLKAEDGRFYSHFGVDPIAMANSAVGRWSGKNLRGASTITMQVIGFLREKSKTHFRRSWFEKVTQSISAVALERVWSKKQILEAYINLVYFRGEIQGLRAASHGLLDKAPFALNLTESSVLASLIRAPNAKLEMIKQRACWLIQSIRPKDRCDELEDKTWANLENGYQIKGKIHLAPHVALRLTAEPSNKTKSQINSTIDRHLQEFVLTSLKKNVLQWQAQNLNDGAAIVLDNETGSVLAYVANIGDLSEARHVDAVRAPRQAGSTLKPFIYAQAIEERLLTSATLLKDEPYSVAVATGVYRPNNFDKGFRTLVSVRSALGSSLNIPAVEALDLVGVDRFVDKMTELGFTSLQRAEFYGPSLALGSADVRLIELTNAYRALANLGEWSEVRFSPEQQVAAPKRVFDPQTAFIISDILSDSDSRSDTFGVESVLSTPFWTAVKTGTSKDMRDNWCVGYSDKFTVGVWAGNLSGESMWNVSGVHGAGPVWAEIMGYLHRNTGSQKPRLPTGVIQKTIFFPHSGQHKDEVFLTGTEPASDVQKIEDEVHSKIVHPVDATFIAMDPDIPPSRHRLFFQVSGPVKGMSFYINNQFLGPAAAFVPWKPEPGRYKLELRDGQRTIDVVQFTVKGKKMKTKRAHEKRYAF